MRISFLLGSGVSLASGAPSTEALTDSLQLLQHTWRHSSGAYVRSSADDPQLVVNPAPPYIGRLIRTLRRHALGFFERFDKQRSVTYEDIYYLVSQIHDARTEYENPALWAFIRKVERRLLELDVDGDLDRPLRETQNYIRDTISSQLVNLSASAKHLEPIVAAIGDFGGHVGLATLNHDTLVEQTLKRSNIEVADGFRANRLNASPLWTGEFDFSGRAVCLVKLHGSVDWHSFRSNSSLPTQICRCSTPEQHWPPGEPQLLVGTFNKMLDYTTIPIFSGLFCAFRSLLAESDRLVIAGYSFGDKGVNSALVQWVRAASNRRVMVISPVASGYEESARGAIRDLISQNRAQFRMLDRGFEHLDWAEIKQWALSAE